MKPDRIRYRAAGYERRASLHFPLPGREIRIHRRHWSISKRASITRIEICFDRQTFGTDDVMSFEFDIDRKSTRLNSSHG